MDKYKICRIIGRVLIAIGVICLGIALSIDIDNGEYGVVLAILGIAISMLIMCIGQIFINLDWIEGFVVGVVIIIGNALFSRFPKNQFFRRCNKVMRKYKNNKRRLLQECTSLYSLPFRRDNFNIFE